MNRFFLKKIWMNIRMNEFLWKNYEWIYRWIDFFMKKYEWILRWIDFLWKNMNEFLYESICEKKRMNLIMNQFFSTSKPSKLIPLYCSQLQILLVFVQGWNPNTPYYLKDKNPKFRLKFWIMSEILNSVRY